MCFLSLVPFKPILFNDMFIHKNKRHTFTETICPSVK